MIEINIQIKDEGDETLVKMTGLAEGDDYSSNEADVADAVAESVKATQFPGADVTVRKDFHHRVGR